METDQFAIQTFNITKVFKSKSGIKFSFIDINLDIPRSCIYALIGANDTGKTTLLKCILGCQVVTDGQILVFGHAPGSKESGMPVDKIGYMPQEIGLCEMLTIGETLLYYGRLVGMTDKDIHSWTEYFMSYLKMPSKNVKNKNLSDGQLRLVSLIIATMHRPRLIILDEPTVGLNPIVKKSMMTFLTSLVSNFSCTILLTTCYIEEARNFATRVGMLHDGHLVVDGSPADVLKRFKVTSLEDVYLKVCEAQEKVEGSTIPGIEVLEPKRRPLTDSCTSVTECRNQDRKMYHIHKIIPACLLGVSRLFTLRRIYATTWKNIIRLCRYPWTFLFLFAFPIFQFSALCYSLGSSTQCIVMGVFNEDNGTFGNQYLETFGSEIMKLEACSSYDNCYNDMMDGKTNGVVHFPANYSEALTTRVTRLPLVSNDILLTSSINILLDNSECIEWEFKGDTGHPGWDLLPNDVIMGKDFVMRQASLLVLMKSLEVFYLEVNFDLGFSKYAGRSVLFVYPHDYKWQILPTRIYLIPAFLFMSCFCCQLFAAFLFLRMEKIDGQMERAFIAGTTSVEIVISFVISQFIVIICQVAVLLLVSFLVFDAPLVGSIVMIVALCFLVSLCGASIGLAIAAVFNSIISFIWLLTIIFFLGWTASAAFWPISAMPVALQYICMALPLYLPSEAMIDIMYYDFKLTDISVIVGFVQSFVWCITSLVISSVAFGLNH